MNKTLLIINFDEDGTDTISNRVMSIIPLMSPESLVGATVTSFTPLLHLAPLRPTGIWTL